MQNQTYIIVNKVIIAKSCIDYILIMTAHRKARKERKKQRLAARKAAKLEAQKGVDFQTFDEAQHFNNLQAAANKDSHNKFGECRLCSLGYTQLTTHTTQYNTDTHTHAFMHARAHTHNTHTQHNTIQYNTTQYNTTQYNTIQYNTTPHNTIQHTLYVITTTNIML